MKPILGFQVFSPRLKKETSKQKKKKHSCAHVEKYTLMHEECRCKSRLNATCAKKSDGGVEWMISARSLCESNHFASKKPAKRLSFSASSGISICRQNSFKRHFRLGAKESTSREPIQTQDQIMWQTIFIMAPRWGTACCKQRSWWLRSIENGSLFYTWFCITLHFFILYVFFFRQMFRTFLFVYCLS